VNYVCLEGFYNIPKECYNNKRRVIFMGRWTKFWVFCLALTLLVAGSVSPASAAGDKESCNCSTKVVYENTLGNKVYEIQTNDEVHYAVVSESTVINDLKEESKLREKVKSKDEVVAGSRVYFHFVKDVSQAKAMADQPKVSPVADGQGVVQPESTYSFWHESYIETWWSLANGTGFHLHLSTTDANYVNNTAATVAGALARTIASFYSITKPAANVIGAAVTVAVNKIGWSLRNNDGSFDLYSPDGDRWDRTCVYEDQYLGSFKILGNWYNLTYPQGWETYCQ
jgi:hypothetical protein